MNLKENFLNLLQINVEETPVIAVVGGGGKTSLIYRLTQELLQNKKTVVITTTTHMAFDQDRPFAEGGDPEKVKEMIHKYGYTVAAEKTEGGIKIGSLPYERMKELRNLCNVLLIEADGSRQLPIKVPEKWEPVIPDFADMVISVVGLDCLGVPIRQTAHRMERTAEFLKKSLDAPVTTQDIIKIASSICGLFKNVEDRVYRVYLNKADVLEEKEDAEIIVTGLKNTVAAYGSLKPEKSGEEWKK